MAATKLINLLAISSLAILACSFGASPVSALSVDTGSHVVRRAPVGHHAALAKKKRGNNSKRCKPRPTTSSIAVTPTSTPTPKASTAAPKTSAAPPPPPPPQSGGGGGKVGIAWDDSDTTPLANFKNGNVGWIYTWSPYIPPAATKLGYKGCPMLWGDKQTSQFAQTVVEGYANCVLGFNEPNQSGQSDMDPGHAAQVWMQYIQPLKEKGYQLIAPACTNDPNTAIPWYNSFFAACTQCTFDGIGAHIYATDPQVFISWVTQLHNTYKLDVWPTEFACQNFSGGAQCTESQVWNWMTTIKGFADGTSWIPAYFAFGALPDMSGVNALNQLLDPSTGQPTSLGAYYIGS